MKNKSLISGLIILSLFVLSCSSSQRGPKSGKKASSSKTGWAYNDRDWGGFEVNLKYKGFQPPVQGMVFVEGGTFVMGQTEENVMLDGTSTKPRAVTVSSFWMDRNEITNVEYREYTDWMKLVFAGSGTEGSARDNEEYYSLYENSLPDTTVWRSKFTYNEPLVEMYFRHPAYNNYPVVGISWEQAMAYSQWRTDRVNERRLCEELGIDMEKYRDNGGGLDDPETYFTTERYLNDPEYNLQNYVDDKKRKKKNGAPGKKPKADLQAQETGKKKEKAKNKTRKVRVEDGILIPDFRLPTEAEWEYAALALIGNSHEDYIKENKVYPWNRHSVRDNVKSNQGEIMANFKLSSGDYMGYGGYHNDIGSLTTPVRSFMANDFGLYDMAGNVAEWTLDVYRQNTSTLDDLNPHRGNHYKQLYYKEPDSGEPRTEPLRISDIADDEDLVERFGYKWDPINETILYGIDVQPSDFVLVNPYENYTDTDFEIYSNEDSYDYNEPNSQRRNYTTANNTGDRDGEGDSGGIYANEQSFGIYDYGQTTMVNNYTRVYKGGSWKDDAYWLSPGTRKFLNQDLSSDFIGFRCVIDHMGFEGSQDAKKPRRKSKTKRK